MTTGVKVIVEAIDNPAEYNLIFGQSHFIKTVEDLYEVMVNSVPCAKFGIAFNEASGPCLTRFDGNDQQLIDLAVKNLVKIGSGHTFLIFMQDAYPINVLPAVKSCREVVSVYCATANPVQVVLAESAQGRGVLGVIDGSSPKGVESEADIRNRKEFLVNIGYKR